MAKRALRLNILVLACLCVGWPLAANPEPARPAERLQVSQTAPLEANDPLALWFKEQDRILDDILARLARIELLVREIHRLISQIPDRLQAPPPAPSTPVAPAPAPVSPAVPAASAPAPAPTPAAAPTPPPAPTEAAPAQPVAETKKPRRPPPPEEEEEPEAPGLLALLAEHGPLAGGGLLLLLLLLIWLRRRKARAAPQPAAPASASAAAAKLTEPAPLPAQTSFAAAAEPALTEPNTISIPPSSLDLGSSQADQALELAEIMLSMGLGHGAAKTLAEQIRNEPKQALRQWLKLLEIYRANGQQEEFERSAEELRLHFNIKPEDWNVRQGPQQSVENFPHIATRIVALWPRPDCLLYLENLLADNRGGVRSGFPQAVAEELLLLDAVLRIELAS